MTPLGARSGLDPSVAPDDLLRMIPRPSSADPLRSWTGSACCRKPRRLPDEPIASSAWRGCAKFESLVVVNKVGKVDLRV